MNKIVSFFRIDERVFLAMGGLCILAILTLAFKIGTQSTCSPIKIAVGGDAYLTGKSLHFKASTTANADASTLVWDFGDGTTGRLGADPYHSYTKPGRYTISVTTGGECTDYQIITIGQAPKLVNVYQPLFSSPQQAFVNEPVTFEDTSKDATSWEWTFGDGSQSIKGKKVSHSFAYTGNMLVVLKVNDKEESTVSRYVFVTEKPIGDPVVKEKQRTSKQATIIVRPDPIVPPLPQPDDHKEEPKPEPKPEPKKAPDLSKEALNAMLMEVANGSKGPDDFQKFFPENTPNLSVIFDNKQMSFSQMCNELKDIKGKNIKTITALPQHNANNYIVFMNVTVDKKGFLKRLFKK